MYSLDAIYRQLLRALPADGEDELEEYIDNYPGGRDELRKRDAELKKLLRIENKYSVSSMGNSGPVAGKRALAVYAASDEESEERLNALKIDISTSISAVIDEKFTVFEGKLNIQLARVQANLGDMVQRAGDRLVKAFPEGARERLLDPVSDLSSFLSNFLSCILIPLRKQDMYGIWVDMVSVASMRYFH